MQGPFGIVCRAHSGSRILSEALVRSGIWLGDVTRGKSGDTRELRRNAPVRRILKHAFTYPDMSPEKKETFQDVLRSAITPIRETAPEAATAYGFKHPLMSFCVEMFLDAYPEGKIIHLIRDGRDVMLSHSGQVTTALTDGRARDRLIVLGDGEVDSYRGVGLREADQQYRVEIEMLYWKLATEQAMLGRKYPDRYLEVTYEALCADPVAVLEAIYAFIDYPLTDDVREWAQANVHDSRVRKWAGREEELSQAIAIGAPLLEKLGYLEAS